MLTELSHSLVTKLLPLVLCCVCAHVYMREREIIPCMSLHVQEKLMCECVIIIVKFHLLLCGVMWCMCSCVHKRERERKRKRDTVYVASTVSHVCVYNIFKSRQ